MATCAEVVDRKLPNDAAEDSYSMLSVLLGEQGEEPVREYQIQQTNRLAMSIRQGNWKYLDHQGSGGNNYDRTGPFGMKPYALKDTDPDAPCQLYTLEEDPGETTNLYSKHPEIVHELKDKLEHFKESRRSAHPGRSDDYEDSGHDNAMKRITMNRSLQTLRMVVGVVLLAAAVTGVAAGGGEEPGDEAPNVSGSRPNIILFLADDLSYWDISHFGQEEFSTGHLDRMAREGMVFTNAYSASPQWASSRDGLLTGLHMGRSTTLRAPLPILPAKRPNSRPMGSVLPPCLSGRKTVTRNVPSCIGNKGILP